MVENIQMQRCGPFLPIQITQNLNDRCLHQWVAGAGGNTAVIVTVASHLNVALISPGGSPRVLHKPVVFTFFACSVSNSKDLFEGKDYNQ